MINRLAPALALTLLLAGCGSAEEGEGANTESISMEDAAAGAKASAMKPEPGQYRVTMELLELDVPGAPQGAKDMMRGMMGGQSHEYCLKQGDVDKGFEEMARQTQENKDCSFERFDIDNGRFDGRMVCNVQGQGRMTITMQGEGSPTSSTMETRMEGDFAGMGQSTIRMRASHERIGDCS
ncbi:MAG: hypothetical protein C0510_04505 [Erythrobacter sp.]|nr:hypothetical protein [Erythrobacter sp.]